MDPSGKLCVVRRNYHYFWRQTSGENEYSRSNNSSGYIAFRQTAPRCSHCIRTNQLTTLQALLVSAAAQYVEQVKEGLEAHIADADLCQRKRHQRMNVVSERMEVITQLKINPSK